MLVIKSDSSGISIYVGYCYSIREFATRRRNTDRSRLVGKGQSNRRGIGFNTLHSMYLNSGNQNSFR